MTKTNYFKGITDLAELKKVYKDLAFKHHPDCGGDLETMQHINAEYDEVMKTLKTKKGGKYKADDDGRYDGMYKDMIDRLIKLHMENVTIEVCGWFIWIQGETKPYKDELKALKLNWHRTKKCWYYKPDWYQAYHVKTATMDEIRSAYGSTVINPRDQKQEEKKEEIKEIA